MPRDFQTDFLSELEALDEFLVRRRGGDRFVQPEDPDVRRLMEALAFFSARTHEAAAAGLRGAVHRLAHGLLEDFSFPQPTRAMLRAVPNLRLTDPAHIPRGSRVRLEAPDGEVGQFTTMTDVTVRPIDLDHAELQRRGGAGYRVLLRLRSRIPTAEMAEPLALHIDQLGDYEVSREFLECLRKHMTHVAVVYGDPPAVSERGQACTFGYGLSRGDAERAAPGEGQGSVARIREFFHFPVKDLVLRVELARAPRPWRQAWLCLDLDEWPEGQVVHRDMFRLFMVPIENLFTELAEPIKCDGTRASHAIRPWRAGTDIAFHSLVEVHQEMATGLDLILPGHLASGEESYELEHFSEDSEPRLLLRLPDAFAHPRNILVGARWYQPRFAAVAVGKLEASLQSRHFVGVEFRVQGGLAPRRSSALWGDPDAMLHVLSRRSKRVLSRSDIVKLMTILGADVNGYHGDVADDIRQIEVHDEPASLRGSGGVQHVYRVLLGDIAPRRRGLLVDYLRAVEELVNAWSNNPAVLLTVEHNTRRDGARAAT